MAERRRDVNQLQLLGFVGNAGNSGNVPPRPVTDPDGLRVLLLLLSQRDLMRLARCGAQAHAADAGGAAILIYRAEESRVPGRNVSGATKNKGPEASLRWNFDLYGRGH